MQPLPPTPVVLHLGRVLLNGESREAWVGDLPLLLTRSEFVILSVLSVNVGCAVTSRDLLSAIWQRPWVGDTTAVQVHVSRLRRKLRLAGVNPAMIRTVRGYGYRLDAPPPDDAG